MLRKLTRFVAKGKIKDGKLVFDNEKYFRTLLSKYADTPRVRIIVEKERGNKTRNQLAYLYGIVYKSICEYTGFHEAELDAAMKSKYLRTKMQWRGGDLTIIKDKRNLTSDEMSEYIQRVCEEAAELGVIVPIADADYYVKEQFPEHFPTEDNL